MGFDRIAVLGAGAWGTALATVAARPGRRVTLWTRDPAAAAAMAEHRENRRSLPGVPLADGILPTASHELLAEAELILVVVPAQHLRATLGAAPPFAAGVPLVLCAKGIEAGTGLLMSDVLAVLPAGPSRRGAVRPELRRQMSAAVGRPPSRSRPRTPTSPGGSPRRWATPVFRAYHSRTTCAASRSAEPPRTCSPSPAGWRQAWSSAPAHRRR